MHVLLVEDDPTLLHFLTILVEHAGLTATSVERGDSALDAIRSERFDAVVLDLLLPGMTGFEIIQHLHDTHPHLLRRIIVLTGVTRSSLNALPFASLLWDVMRKPFDIEAFTRSLNACIEFHAAPRLVLQADVGVWLEEHSTKMGAKAGVVAAVQNSSLNLLAAFGYPPKVADAYFPISLSSPYPICSAVRTSRAVWLASITRDSGDYPLLAPIWKSNRSQAIAAVPLLRNDRAVGAIGLSFPTPQSFDQQQRDAFLRLAEESLPLVELRDARAS